MRFYRMLASRTLRRSLNWYFIEKRHAGEKSARCNVDESYILIRFATSGYREVGGIVAGKVEIDYRERSRADW